MNWITTDYDFGLPIMGIKISGVQLRRLGIHASGMFESKEKIVAIFTLMKDRFPLDAILVRISMPPNQDAVIFYIMSKENRIAPEFGEIEIVNLKEDSEIFMSV